jgi:hypothetical protein
MLSDNEPVIIEDLTMESYDSSAATTFSPGVLFAAVIRLVGLGVMLIGLIGAFYVASRAWNLLENPERIAKYSEEVEKQSHLNAFIGRMNSVFDFIEQAESALPAAEPEKDNKKTQDPSRPASPTLESTTLNASYFAAWGIVILLLALIARICFWAIREGGTLALYSVDSERQLRIVMRELVNEIRSPRLRGQS